MTNKILVAKRFHVGLWHGQNKMLFHVLCRKTASHASKLLIVRRTVLLTLMNLAIQKKNYVQLILQKVTWACFSTEFCVKNSLVIRRDSSGSIRQCHCHVHGVILAKTDALVLHRHDEGISHECDELLHQVVLTSGAAVRRP